MATGKPAGFESISVGKKRSSGEVLIVRTTQSLGVYPIGINAPKFEQTLDSKEFHQRREEFRLAHEGKRLVVSVEHMDYTKGILHRLEAIDNFLAGSDNIDAIRFMFVSIPSREGIEEYQHLAAPGRARTCNPVIRSDILVF